MKYKMETLTREECIELIKSGDDSYRNQIRVTKTGYIYLSRIVGAEDIKNLKFRLETFDARNGYVGIEASENKKYVDNLYKNLIKTWEKNRTGYIDYWI